jgi:hypothetical protein
MTRINNERTVEAIAFVREAVRGNKAATAAVDHIAEHFAALTSATPHADAIKAANFRREHDVKLAKWLRDDS